MGASGTIIKRMSVHPPSLLFFSTLSTFLLLMNIWPDVLDHAVTLGMERMHGGPTRWKELQPTNASLSKTPIPTLDYLPLDCGILFKLLLT